MSIIFLIVLTDLIGFGIVLPLLPFYASQFQASAISIGFLYSIYSLAQLIFSPIWGGLSDRLGRRPILLLSTFGNILAYTLFALSPSFLLLFFSRLLAGVMGGNISTAQSYMGDITTGKDRTKAMGLIGAAFGIGFVLGPALATVLIQPKIANLFPMENKYAIPGFFAACLSFVSFLLVLFKLPETVKKNSVPFSVQRGIFSQSFWKTIVDRSAQSKTNLLPLMLLSLLLLSIGHSSLYSAFPLFCKTILSLNVYEVSAQFVYMGLIAIFVQGFLIRLLIKKIDESTLFLVGSLLMSAGLGLIPFATSKMTLTLFLATLSLGASLNGPTLNSMISKKAPAEKMGATMGVSQSLSALGRVIGPTLGGWLITLHFRAPFLVTSSLVGATCGIGLFLKKNKNTDAC